MAITDWKRLDERTVLLIFSGALTGNEHEQLARTLGEIAADSPVERLILDKTRLELGHGAGLADKTARDAARVMCDNHIHAIAFVAKPGQAGINPFRKCFERICGSVNVVDSVQRAADWLEVDADAVRHPPDAG